MRAGALVVAGFVGCGLMAVAGCSSTPTPAPPARLSPPIGDITVDLSKSVDAPCGLVGPDQLGQLSITAPGRLNHTSTGLACTWVPDGVTSPSYQASVDMTSGGVEALYHRRSQFTVFEPTAIHGYPSVHLGNDVTAEQHGHCTVETGVADPTLLIVSVVIAPGTADYDDPCSDADRFAGYIIGYQGARSP
ncbi:MAG: hypothetical protein JWQ81_7145 [Amycolatopsis sp.]|uniref:DUF3558 domain-containing protein n=1 Tax=Amycolatopsis sp. TaxID=37632 RepID=UPI002614BF99|nr:DUF3558 domain-containing protein [Amycolatopsis sp.]MCU1686406.1 hypothetical protein [Amycolatopsis sp.]